MNLPEILEQYSDLLRIVGLPFNEKTIKILMFALKYNGKWFQAKEMINTLNINKAVIYTTLTHLEKLGIVETTKPKIPEDLGIRARKSYKKEKYGNSRIRKLYRIHLDGFKKLIDDKIQQLEILKKNL